MIENFRYNSSWEDYNKAVKLLKDLLKKGKAYWLIGFLKGFDLYIDDTVATDVDSYMAEIIYNEIVYLVMSVLEDSTINLEEMRKAILNVDGEISEEELENALLSVQNKLELAKDSFDISELSLRYNLKRDAINSKLSDFEYNICTHNISDRTSIKCALINMECKKKVSEFREQGIGALFAEKQQQEITFICDETDINVWIQKLEEIRRRLREYNNE